MSADSQFQLLARYPGNLDRCRRCGIPRKMHGADGSCNLSLGAGLRTVLGVAAVALAALAGASWLLASNTHVTAGSVAAFAALVAIIVLAASAAVAGRGT